METAQTMADAIGSKGEVLLIEIDYSGEIFWWESVCPFVDLKEALT